VNKKVKQQNEELDKKRITALFKEHEEIIKLFIHEDTLAWNLIYFYLVMTFALISSIGLLYTQSQNISDIIEKIVFSSLCFLGFFLSVGWFFIMARSRIHHLSRILKAYKIENELESFGYPIDTLKSCEQTIYEGKVLKNPQGDLRDLNFYEKIGVLKLIRRTIPIVGIIWLLIGLIILF